MLTLLLPVTWFAGEYFSSLQINHREAFISSHLTFLTHHVTKQPINISGDKQLIKPIVYRELK